MVKKVDEEILVQTDSKAPGSSNEKFNISQPDERLFIGRLVRNKGIDPTLPGEYCLDDNQLWKGFSHRIGRLNMISDNPIPEQLLNRTVVAIGVKKSSLDDKIVKTGPCHEEDTTLQFRLDWYSDEGGSFTTHGKLKAIDYIQVEQIVPVVLLTMPQSLPLPRKGIRTTGNSHDQIIDSITISVRNPFSIEIKNISLVIHYEGGSHKQMPYYTFTSVSLHPGDIRTLVFPEKIERQNEKYTEYYFYQEAYLIGIDEKLVFLGPAQYKIDSSGI